MESEINPSSSSRRRHTTCPHIHLAPCVEDSWEVFWENEPHALQGPRETSDSVVEKSTGSLGIISLTISKGNQEPCVTWTSSLPRIHLLPWPTRKPIIGHILYSQSLRHFDNSRRKNQNRSGFFQNSSILGGTAETKSISSHNVIMPFGPAAFILFWFPVPGSLLSRLFWLNPVWGVGFLAHPPPYFMINLIQFPMQGGKLYCLTNIASTRP